MAVAIPTSTDRHPEHYAQERAATAHARTDLVRPATSDLPVQTKIPPETRMLAFVMVYMLAVAVGVGALLVRL